MDSIKSIDGIIKDSEGQISALADVARERYWQKQAQVLPPVEAAKDAVAINEKHRDQTQEKLLVQSNHTYVEFEINKDTREVIVRIIEAESGKLIRTIPPDELAKEIIKGNFQPNQLRRRAVLV